MLRRNRSLRLFAFTFLVTSAYMLARIVGDSLLLARVGPGALPFMLVISAVIVGMISYIWAAGTSRLAINRLLLVTQLGSITITLSLSFLLHLFPENALVIGGVYVLAELRGCFNMILISTLLNEHFCENKDKGTFALINAGSPLAGIITGLLVGLEAGALPAEFLMATCCLLDIVAVMSASFVTSHHAHAFKLASPETPTLVTSKVYDAALLGDELRLFTRALVVMVIAKTTVLAVVGYEWKVMADRLLSHDERALETYFGWFYAVSDTLILIGQLCCTRGLLNRLGIPRCLLLLPIGLSLTGAASLCTRDSWILFLILTIARGLQVVRRSIHDVAVQVVYGTLPQSIRRKVVARVLGVAKPVTEASTAIGICLLTLAQPPQTLAWFWIPVLIVWLWWAVKLGLSWQAFQHAARGSTPDASTCAGP